MCMGGNFGGGQRREMGRLVTVPADYIATLEEQICILQLENRKHVEAARIASGQGAEIAG